MIWYVEENKTEVSYGNTNPRNFVVWYVEENFLELLNCCCCFDVKVLVCKAMKNVQVFDGRKKSAWTGLDRVDFEKKLFKELMFKSKNRRGQV
jgi:hypothetical protein